MTLHDLIRRELTIAYDHGKVAGERQWPGADRDQVAEIGAERIEQAIEIARQSSAANVAAPPTWRRGHRRRRSGRGMKGE